MNNSEVGSPGLGQGVMEKNHGTTVSLITNTPILHHPGIGLPSQPLGLIEIFEMPSTNNTVSRRIVMKKLLVLLSCLLLFPIPAHAKQKAKASAETASETLVETPKKTGNEWLNVEITDAERQEIMRYYQDGSQAAPKGQRGQKSKGVPKGLQKKVAKGGDLPPGWQTKVAKGEVLDTEVYQHATPLPKELTMKLPPAPDGTVLVKVEGKVIRLYEATRTILDVFDIGR